MYPLDVTHVVLRRWRAGVRGRIDPRIGIGAGAPACLRRQACSYSSQSGLVPSVCGTLPPPEGGLHVRLSHRIVHHAMAKQLPFSFFLCGRKLTCPSMPIISATRKTDKANHWRVSGPQHIL